MVGAEALHLQYPTRVVFDDLTVGVNDGDRIGIAAGASTPQWVISDVVAYLKNF